MKANDLHPGSVPGLGLRGTPNLPLAIRQSLAQHVRHVRWGCLVYLAGAAVWPFLMGLDAWYRQSCFETGVRPIELPVREWAASALLLAATVLAWACTLTRSALTLGTFVAPVLRWGVLLAAALAYLSAWALPLAAAAGAPFIMATSLLTLVMLLYLSQLAAAAGLRLLPAMVWVAVTPQIIALLVLCLADFDARAVNHGGLVLLWVALPAGYASLWVWRMSGAPSMVLHADARLRFVAGDGRRKIAWRG